MAEPFKPVASEPGLYQLNDSAVETPTGSGLYAVEGLVESPPGSGLFLFEAATAGATVTITVAPPTARITLREDDLLPGTARVTLYRIAEGRTTEVRAGKDLFAAGGAVLVDYEIPLGVPVTYRAQQYAEDGTELGYTGAVEVTVPVDSPYRGWISDPLDATVAVPVVFSDAAGRSPSAPIPGTVYRVGDRTVALVGQQGLLENLNMDFFTETLADRDALLGLLRSSGGLVLIRSAPALQVPRLLYCWAANAVPDTFAGEFTAWANTVQEVSPTEGGIVLSPVTWQTYIDAFPTWEAFNAAYLTWFDAMENPPEV
jgi:hypothetical protein